MHCTQGAPHRQARQPYNIGIRRLDDMVSALAAQACPELPRALRELPAHDPRKRHAEKLQREYLDAAGGSAGTKGEALAELQTARGIVAAKLRMLACPPDAASLDHLGAALTVEPGTGGPDDCINAWLNLTGAESLDELLPLTRAHVLADMIGSALCRADLFVQELALLREHGPAAGPAALEKPDDLHAECWPLPGTYVSEAAR